MTYETIIDIVYFVVVAVMTVYNLFRGRSVSKNLSLLASQAQVQTSEQNKQEIAAQVREQVKEFMEELLKEKE